MSGQFHKHVEVMFRWIMGFPFVFVQMLEDLLSAVSVGVESKSDGK
jgi:hypothetical protein